MAKVVTGKFSNTEVGNRVRRMYDASGAFIGTITKQEDGSYRVYRMKDGKIRTKQYLSDAYKTIARSN